MKDNKPNIIKVVGLAVGLPSSILGVFAFVYFLIHENYITPVVGLLLIILIIAYTFFLMLKYANKK
jgi:hypothetical protein